MNLIKSFVVSSLLCIFCTALSYSDGSKNGWEVELKKLALNLTSTEVKNSTLYKNAGVANTRLTTDSQTLVQGKLDFAANYFASKLFWSNTLLMEYGKTYLRPVDKEEVINENSDKILLTTDLTYRLWKIENFLGGFEAGPFANIGYETEFDVQEDSNLKKIIRGKAGVKLFEGKYLKELYVAGVGEMDYTYSPESTKTALETGFKAENPIREGLKVVYWGYYRDYLTQSKEKYSDLDYEFEAEIRLDVMLYKNFSLAPFVNYYSASAQYFNGVGENWYTGISLSYSTFFAKAKEI